MPESSTTSPQYAAAGGSVTVRYWAAARAAAGRETDMVEPGSLAEVLDRVRALHHGNERFAKVLAMCSILVGESPAGHGDHGAIVVPPGGTVELLPPFAGGDSRYSAGGDSRYSAGGDSRYSAGGDSRYSAGGDSRYSAGGDSRHSAGGDSRHSAGGDTPTPSGRHDGRAPLRSFAMTSARR